MQIILFPNEALNTFICNYLLLQVKIKIIIIKIFLTTHSHFKADWLLPRIEKVSTFVDLCDCT